ncbi:hypothetical protein [Lysobacter brunescens]|uniref:DUF1579 domain-containing protein n=1 Tax=Lysobacter brunescens TaxID=262323 RepID=A0ABW2Y9F5_9GAMM
MPPAPHAPSRSALPGSAATASTHPLTASTATDFDFIHGDWRVRHRRLRARLADCTEWVDFDGTSSTRPILGGQGNLEDNRIELPEGAYRAVALRTFDPTAARWSIWWLDGHFPDRLDVPVVDSFEGGLGTFLADDDLDGRPIRVRFRWQVAGRDRARWEQAFSDDGGETWETNWTMDFLRA